MLCELVLSRPNSPWMAQKQAIHLSFLNASDCQLIAF